MPRIRFRSLDIALLLASIRIAEDAEADAGGPSVIMIPVDDVSRYQVIRAADVPGIIALLDLDLDPAPERAPIEDIVVHLTAVPYVPVEFLPAHAAKRLPRRTVRKVSPTKEAPRKAPKRKPPTRRKRDP